MKLVILDRDGVINQDSDHFIKTVDEFIPLAGSVEAIAKLKHAGYKVYIATNQSGIFRGYYDETTLNAMHEKLAQLLKEHDAEIDGIEYCPHGPDDNCNCRKPKAGMYLSIAEQSGISNHSEILVVGDSLRDLQAAQAIGAKPHLVKTGKGQQTIKNNPGINHPVFENLYDAAKFITSEK